MSAIFQLIPLRWVVVLLSGLVGAGYISVLRSERTTLTTELRSAQADAQAAQTRAYQLQDRLEFTNAVLATTERQQAAQRASSAKIKDTINASPNGGSLDPVVLDALDGLRQRNGRPQ